MDSSGTCLGKGVYGVVTAVDAEWVKKTVVHRYFCEQAAHEVMVYASRHGPARGISPDVRDITWNGWGATMTLQRGTCLVDLLRLPALGLSARVSYALQILGLYRRWSARGLYHFDVKPDNFVVVDGRLRVIDWGMARTEASRLCPLDPDMAYSVLFRHPGLRFSCPQVYCSGRFDEFEVWAVAKTVSACFTKTCLPEARDVFGPEVPAGPIADFLTAVLVDAAVRTRVEALGHPVFSLVEADAEADAEAEDAHGREFGGPTVAAEMPAPPVPPGHVDPDVWRVAVETASGALRTPALCAAVVGALAHLAGRGSLRTARDATVAGLCVCTAVELLATTEVSGVFSAMGFSGSHLTLYTQGVLECLQAEWWGLLTLNPFTVFARRQGLLGRHAALKQFAANEYFALAADANSVHAIRAAHILSACEAALPGDPTMLDLWSEQVNPFVTSFACNGHSSSVLAAITHANIFAPHVLGPHEGPGVQDGANALDVEGLIALQVGLSGV
jgi:hypothetical protein